MGGVLLGLIDLRSETLSFVLPLPRLLHHYQLHPGLHSQSKDVKTPSPRDSLAADNLDSDAGEPQHDVACAGLVQGGEVYDTG